jgi:hypothetical protein
MGWGFSWKVENERKARFWEDQWFVTCSLAIQFWEVYSIINEQGKIVAKAWDGVDLKFTFRRTADRNIMNQWREVVQIASSIQFGEDEDEDAII